MIRKAIIKHKWLGSLVIALGIVISFCSVMSVMFFQRLIDAITVGLSSTGSKHHLFEYISYPLAIYSLFTISDCLLAYLYEYPYVKLKNSIYQYFRIAAVEKVSKVDYKSLNGLGLGQILQMVENGAVAGRDIIIDFFASVFGWQTPKIIMSLIVLGAYNINIMLVICVGYVAIFVVTKILLKRLYSLKNRIITNQEAMSKRFVLCLMEVVTFRVNRLYRKEIEGLQEDAKRITNDTARIRMIHEAFFTIFYFLIIIIKVAIIIISVVITDNITIGAIVAMVTLVDNIYQPIAIFNVSYVDYQLNKIAFNRYDEFMNLDDDSGLVNGKKILGIERGISAENVTFKYGDRSVVKNMSFDARLGSSIAIVGESGSGKSTMIKLVMGLLKSDQGSIRVDNFDLNEVDLSSYYENITYISQDTPVFDASVRRNVVFDKSVDDSHIMKALKLVKLDDLVMEMENGLDTDVGERGVKLSGGEKQRLALARIFFDDSKIVILDEVTSGMDYILEEFVMQNLYKAIRDKILIVIAHRLNTIQAASHIIVMKDGAIEQQGTFDDLLCDYEGYFVSLWNKRNVNY